VSAHFPCEVSREKLFKAEILEKMVTSMMSRDSFFIPPFLGSNSRFTTTEHKLDRLFKW
jgi:hypothetical protein